MAAPHYAGIWDVQTATLPDGTFAYSGTISIARQQAIWLLDWDISAGRYVGVGLECAGHLLVSCGEQHAGLGLALFERQTDSAIAITWCSAELGGQVGGGRFLAPWGGEWAGEHEVAQTLPDGRAHGAWQLSIQPAGQIYELAWRRGEIIHWHGLGLPTPRGLAAAWSPDIRQLAFLDYTHPADDLDQLHATWALGGFTSLGREALARRR